MIIQVGEVYLAFNTSVVADFVKIVRGDSRLDLCSNDIQDFSGETAHFAHGLLSLGIQNVDFGPAQLVLSLGYASLCPIRVLDRLWHCALRRERIDWTNGAREDISWERVVQSRA